MDKGRFIKKLGRHIAKVRASKGMSQDQLAASGNISRGTIDRIERGVTNVKIETLLEIAEILEVDVRKLLDFS